VKKIQKKTDRKEDYLTEEPQNPILPCNPRRFSSTVNKQARQTDVYDHNSHKCSGDEMTPLLFAPQNVSTWQQSTNVTNRSL